MPHLILTSCHRCIITVQAHQLSNYSWYVTIKVHIVFGLMSLCSSTAFRILYYMGPLPTLGSCVCSFLFFPTLNYPNSFIEHALWIWRSVSWFGIVDGFSCSYTRLSSEEKKAHRGKLSFLSHFVMAYGPHRASSIIRPTWFSPGFSPVHYDLLLPVYALSSHQAQLTRRVSNAASVTWMRNIYTDYSDFLSIMFYLSDFLILIFYIQGSDSNSVILIPKPLNCDCRVIWGA